MESALFQRLLDELKSIDRHLSLLADEYATAPLGHDHRLRERLGEFNERRDAILAALAATPINLPGDAAAKLEVVIDECPPDARASMRSVIAYLRG